MVRFYWYGLTGIYLVCCVFGMLVGASWGAAGLVMGLSTGATVASGLMLVFERSEGRENAFYSTLSVFFIVALAVFVTAFGGMQT